MRLTDKIAIVTGAASGIGRGIATVFAEEGARVVVADIDDQGGRQTVAEIGGPSVAHFCHADVSNGDQVRALVEDTVHTFGGVDILVNNAAVVTFKKLVDTEEQEWDRVLATNLRGVYLCCRQAIPYMVQRGGGTIVNISSVRALATTPLVSSYDASKGGILALTRSLALEHARDGIRVNCVLPGSVDTPVFRANLRAEGDEAEGYRTTAAAIPLGRIGQPRDIAFAVLYLAGPESSYVTGASLLVDGGLLAQA